jgi:3-oxoacyl-[acyl-carrier-protein] synthase-3
MLEEVVPRLGLKRAKIHLPVAEHGNTSAASIPLALDNAWRSGVIEADHLLLVAGFGGGMSIGTALIRWDGQSIGDRRGVDRSLAET